MRKQRNIHTGIQDNRNTGSRLKSAKPKLEPGLLTPFAVIPFEMLIRINDAESSARLIYMVDFSPPEIHVRRLPFVTQWRAAIFAYLLSVTGLRPRCHEAQAQPHVGRGCPMRS